MATKNKKNDSESELYYVFRKCKKPDIYPTYDEALKHKYDWDERPVIRKFTKWHEAIYYFKTGELIPPPPPRKESKSRPLF